MDLFDSHCHLDDPAYEPDVKAVFERARSAGVRRLMTVGTTLETSRRALALARGREGVYASVGVHPHDAAACT